MTSNLRPGLVALTLLGLLGTGSAFAQKNRIHSNANPRERVALRGNVTPRAHTDEDQGPVDPALPLPAVTMVLQPSPEQEAALEQFLADQQNPGSPNYHHWLTPEEYADRFGVSAEDIAKIQSWAQAAGLKVTGVGRGRNWISFSGTASQVSTALGTEIHNYLVNGEQHFANTADPAVPAAFQGVVRAIHGLDSFRMHPPSRALIVSRRFPVGALPQYTASSGNHYLAPADFATLYNVKPLHDAGYTGLGQKVVVVGQTQIRTADLQQFRTTFSLTAADPQVTLVPNTPDPGIVKGDIDEAALDLEWVGAVAPDATLLYVYSENVMDALQYAVDQNLAPVISMSYGLCELETSQADAATLRVWSRQAAAQGITWFAASGDDGAADCGASSRFNGLAVDLPAALPEVTGVGGTTFDESGGTYWGTSNNAARGSALSYIPEGAWNDSTVGSLASGGGGASVYFTKPSWQTGSGVPLDGVRDVPDVALSASSQHDGYLIYSGGSLAAIGGTSAGAPSFAGIAALLNQYLVATGSQSAPGLGNINPRLYSLAQTTPSVFHDVVKGNNIVTACNSRRNCTATSVGYNAAAGYDQATGLGSVDAYLLVNAWSGGTVSFRSASLVLSAEATRITTADTVVLRATVQSADGGVPTGSVTFSSGNTVLGTVPLSATGGAAVATLTVSASLLSVGAANITAQYTGDGSYSSASASIVITVSSGNSGPPSITGIANAASFRQSFAPGMILSVFGSQLAPSTQEATAVPLPEALGGVSVTVNGLVAPLYYVSSGQLNVQVPYGVAPGTALLAVNNNGQSASVSFAVGLAAPGVFVDSNGAPAGASGVSAGQVATVYITGAGALTPALATGAAPAAGTGTADLPKPAQPVGVTLGNVLAPIQFVGNPAGLVGVTQINYLVPAGTASGSYPLVVTVGAFSSASATQAVKP